MKDIIITGASRGIGRALALELSSHSKRPTRLILTARDEQKLNEVAQAAIAVGTKALSLPGDLSTIDGARALAEGLAGVVESPAILVHNAGLWPTQRQLTADGFESAFAVNFLCPLTLQKVLLEQRCLDRVMVISAGLIIKGRYSAERTPRGLDFSRWRTYCTTKLAFAVAEREAAAEHPEIDFIALHPGVVRTDLGLGTGLLSKLLSLAKRSWEPPEVCAARLSTLFEIDRWSPPGEARWYLESEEHPWPAITDDEPTRVAIGEAIRRFES